MSTSTPPPPPPTTQDPNLISQRPDPPVPLSSNADLPPDPLLKSGFFITADSPTPTPTPTSTPTPTTTTTTTTTTTPTATATDAGTTTSAHTPNNKSPKQATSNGSESQSTQPKRRPATEAGPETLEWLPASWFIEDRVRTSGATAGVIDRYYFDPASGRQFRSKKEVLYFLETGTPRKKKKGSESSNADVDSMGSHGSNKQKSGTKGKSAPVPTPAPAPTNFDYSDAPEKIQWVLTKSSEDTWTPFIGKDKVPESTKREWAVAFKFLTTSSGGNKMS